MRNLPLKLISLLCGISLFLFVNYFFSANDEGTRVVQLNAPIEVLNAPANKALIWPAIKQVEITLQGSALFMSKVTLSPPVIKVNLHNFATDKYVAKLSADDVALPATIRLLAMKPTELEFGADPIVSSQTKVVVPQIGKLDENLKLSSIEIIPSEIKLTGPSKELEGVTQIESVPLNLSLIRQTIETELDLRNPGVMSHLENKKVRLRINIEDAVGELSFMHVPVRIESEDSSLNHETLKPENPTVNIRLTGSKKKLKEIKRDSIDPFVRIESKESLSQPLNVELDLGQDLSSINITPSRIELSLPARKVPATTGSKKKN